VERLSRQLQHVDWRRIVLAVAMIVFCYWLRAARWAVLMRPQKKVSSFSLLGSQVIGFTAVALFRPSGGPGASLPGRETNQAAGELADSGLHRGAHVRSGSDGADFSSALLLAPDRATLPHHEALQHTALGGLVVTVALAVFAVSVRASGRAVADLAERPGLFSPALGHSVGPRFAPFATVSIPLLPLGEFFLALGLSLLMWGFITAAYLETTRAFVLSPELSSMTLARCLVLMAASMVGSVVQLPVLGWFTQIGVTTGVMQKIFNVQFEPALACGTMLLIVTFMCVIPLGLIWARIEHVSLKKVSEESEQFVHEDAEQTPAVSEAC
jgi:hypothetical protein